MNLEDFIMSSFEDNRMLEKFNATVLRMNEFVEKYEKLLVKNEELQRENETMAKELYDNKRFMENFLERYALLEQINNRLDTLQHTESSQQTVDVTPEKVADVEDELPQSETVAVEKIQQNRAEEIGELQQTKESVQEENRVDAIKNMLKKYTNI